MYCKEAPAAEEEQTEKSDESRRSHNNTYEAEGRICN
jgi:hypothetical protein